MKIQKTNWGGGGGAGSGEGECRVRGVRLVGGGSGWM